MDFATILNRFGIPWPDADSDKARQAGAAWLAIANAANDAQNKSGTMVNELTANNSGPAMNAFNQYWSTVAGTPGECSGTEDARAMLPVLMQSADALSSACYAFAKAVDDAKHKLEEIAAELGTTVVAGGVATLFTAGLSDAIGAGVSAGLITAGLDAVAVLGTSLDTIITGVLTGIVAGGVDAILDFGMTNSVKADLGDTPAGDDELYGSLIKGVALGAFTGGTGPLIKGAAQTATDATLTHLPDSLSALMPDLPTAIAKIPAALDTRAGTVVTKLSSEYAAEVAVNAPQGKATDPPDIKEVLGEVLDSEIEGAGESKDG